MDDMKKCLIRLSHWIDHNTDHLKGYEELAAILEKQGLHAAVHLRQGIRAIEVANEEFLKARKALAEHVGVSEPSSSERGHGHHHTH